SRVDGPAVGVWPAVAWRNAGHTRSNAILGAIPGAATHGSPPLAKTWRATWWLAPWVAGFGGTTLKARPPLFPPTRGCPAITSSLCTWIVTTLFGWAPTAAA